MAAGALIALAATCLGVSTAGAVIVAPHALFMDQRSRSAVLYLQNPGDKPEEFSVKLQYGYPASDSQGDVYIELIESPGAGVPSAAAWVRALPARAIVQPGQRQAVRLLAQPPAHLADGEYWSRVIVESRAAQEPVAVAGSEAVRVGLTLEMRTITSLTFRKGRVYTGVLVKDLQAHVDGESLVVDVRMERTGNAAYLGRMQLALTDEGGRKVGEWIQVTAVYHVLYRRLVYPVGQLPAGRYRLDVRIETEREDIAPRDVLPAEPVERVLHVVVR